MSVRDSLCARPRETSGSVSANRFDFQRDWALCHLFHLQESGQDYVLVMEHHDDVLVLDSLHSPSCVDCYQVKTADSHWSLAKLLRRKTLKKKKSNSILGKMFANCLVFANQTRSVNFVSNCGYRINLECGDASDTRQEISLTDLEKSLGKKIISQIMEEHGLETEPQFLALAKLIVTFLHKDDHSDHTKGKLAAFLDRARPGVPIAIGPLYKTLYEELRRRANYEKQGLDFDGIIRNKSITREEFEKFVAQVQVTRKIEDDWFIIQSQLIAEHVSFAEVFKLRQCCREYELDRMNRRNKILPKLELATQNAVTQLKADNFIDNLRDWLNQCVAEVRNRRIRGSTIYSDSYLKGMALFEIYGY